MELTLLGRVRKLLEGIDWEGSGNEVPLALSQQLELLTAQGAAPYREIVRLGRAFYVNTTAAVAAVVALPTTGHLLAIYNNEPDGARSLVIDWIAASGVVKTAAAGQNQLLCNIGQVREAAPTAATLTIKRLNGVGGGSNDTRVNPVTAALPATTGVAANWFPWGPSVGNPGAAATPGMGLWAPVDGRIIVPPGRYFAIHVLADVIGSTFQGYIGWHEAQIELG